MIESAVIDLPQPLSPTSASVSPRIEGEGARHLPPRARCRRCGTRSNPSIRRTRDSPCTLRRAFGLAARAPSSARGTGGHLHHRPALTQPEPVSSAAMCIAWWRTAAAMTARAATGAACAGGGRFPRVLVVGAAVQEEAVVEELDVALADAHVEVELRAKRRGSWNFAERLALRGAHHRVAGLDGLQRIAAGDVAGDLVAVARVDARSAAPRCPSP